MTIYDYFKNYTMQLERQLVGPPLEGIVDEDGEHHRTDDTYERNEEPPKRKVLNASSGSNIAT